MATEYSTILVEKSERVGTITFNRPEAMNAINSLLAGEVVAALEELAGDAAVDVVILTGNGKAFSAGVDLKELGQGTPKLLEFPTMWDRVRWFEKPIIAALNGYAIAGGFELMLNCDIIIAAEDARIADTHSRVGVVPAAGLSQILPRLVGIKKAKELIFTCKMLTAKEALDIGLVQATAPAGEVLSAAKAMAAQIVANDQAVVRILKRAIDNGEGLTIADAIKMEQGEHLRYRQQIAMSDVVEQRRANIVASGRAQAK